jgi:hypothetical protein
MPHTHLLKGVPEPTENYSGEYDTQPKFMGGVWYHAKNFLEVFDTLPSKT